MIAHKIFPLVIASFAMTGFAAHLVAQQPAGQKTIDIYSDAVGVGPQANSFSDRLSQVDAAIRCRIERSNVRVTQDPDLPEGADPALGIQIVTEHAVTVLEILKGSSKLPLVGSLLNVTQPVGVATVNGVQARRVQGRFRPFAPGEEYVLLLK